MPNDFSLHDIKFMQRALTLAAKGRGSVEPNPMVGAVLTKNNTLISHAYHHRFGEPHAEALALAQAGPKAKGATLYVTLEPCCHYGKTPPCTKAIIDAQIARVVVAMIDPFAKVHGKGVKLLRQHGIQVDVGLLEASAKSLNAPFITRISKGRPYIIAKWAQSLDGKIALASGDSKWISSEESRGYVQVLRGQVDAIIVGIGTVLADDPLLMARPAGGGKQIHRIATRIVLDSQCRLPLDSTLVRTVPHAPVMLFHGNKLGRKSESARKELEARGVMTVGVEMRNHLKLKLLRVMEYLGAREYTNVLVEGGAEVMGSFTREGLVDEAHVFVAPMIIGGSGAKNAVGGEALKRLADARRFRFVEASRSGVDVHLVGKAEEK